MTDGQFIGYLFLGGLFIWCCFLWLVDFIYRRYKEKKQKQRARINRLIVNLAKKTFNK